MDTQKDKNPPLAIQPDVDLRFIKPNDSDQRFAQGISKHTAHREPMTQSSKGKLKKNLKLFDVYAMATGAMFSSGLFLLPGIAASLTGESAYLAYLFAGFLIIPAMLCMAELSTAMPKAGGTYFFLDRSMGSAVGTIGGLGSWIAVILKSAFALVGMGAYLSLYLDVSITQTAIVLTIVFGAINYLGAKETTLLQAILVTVLVIILTGFVIYGLSHIHLFNQWTGHHSKTEPFFSSGFIGFISTIGLVFVSYAGLTKVASVAEEVKNPDRDIPLGMFLALVTATIIYTAGTYILVKILEPQLLHTTLTPVADAAQALLGPLGIDDLGVLLIVIAATAAFASTANAGIMSASRYPFAMARDELLPKSFIELNRFKTPGRAIALTTLSMIIILMLLDVESVAKLASAFQLLLFGLISFAVIVMRESKIETYKPGYYSPMYPWVPIAGLLISFWLIIEMGILAIGFTGLMTIGCLLWYQFYVVRKKIGRKGAILHVHARLGRMRCRGLEKELSDIQLAREQRNIIKKETTAKVSNF